MQSVLLQDLGADSASSPKLYYSNYCCCCCCYCLPLSSMEYWNTHPTESDFSFAQTTQSSIPADLDWQEHCNLADIPLQAEPTQKSLLDTKPLPAPAKLLADLTNDHVGLELIPQGKKIKTENPISARSKLYEGWLLQLQKLVKELPLGHERSKGLENETSRLLELLKFVMVELEHKLVLDDFKTQGSEHSFWASVQTMARKCEVDYCYFEKICCSSVFKDVTLASDCSLPRLVDQGHDSPWGKLTTYSSAGYSNMPSSEVFQEFPLATVKNDTYTAPSSTSFGQLAFLKLQRQIYASTSAQCPEQGQQFYPPGSLYSDFSSSKAALQHSNTRVSVPNGNPLKKKSTQSLSEYVDSRNPLTQFPATVPVSCRRRIQRNRKRAISYDHLSTNFGASASSLALNRTIDGASDLQFLLEKELKPSDVGSLGRIILPKRQAEEKLPHLEAKEGMPLQFHDMQTSQIWQLRFRYWPNNKTRMYLLESTGNFVKSHRLQEGDFIFLYRNPATGTYMIDGKKAAWPKCLGVSGRKGLPAPCESGGGDNKPSPEPVQVHMTKAPGTESLTQQQGSESATTQQTIVDESDCGTVGEMDLMACEMWEMEDPDELMRGFSELEEDGRSIEELFGFKE